MDAEPILGRMAEGAEVTASVRMAEGVNNKAAVRSDVSSSLPRDIERGK